MPRLLNDETGRPDPARLWTGRFGRCMGATAIGLLLAAAAPGPALSGAPSDRVVAAVEADAPQPAGTLAGVVRSASGRPLAGAVVTLPGPGRTAVTAGDGRFELRVAPGRHRLHVVSIGHAPQTLDAEVASGEVVRVEVVLAETPLALPGVHVTATPTGRDAHAVAQPTATLAGRALERALAGTIAQTLDGQPGIAVRWNGPAAAVPVLRGLTGERILILQDGRRSADLAGSADDHAVTIDAHAARRVEVVRGPASLLHGPNALGGVVNVISGDIPDHVPAGARGTAAVQAESAYPGASAGVAWTLPLGARWAAGVRGGGRVTDDVRIGADPVLGRRLDNTQNRTWQGALGLGYVGERVTGGFAAQLHDLRYGLPAPPGDEVPVELAGRKLALDARLSVRLGSDRFPGLRAGATLTDYAHDELEHGQVAQAFALRTQTFDVLLRQAQVGPFVEGAWGAAALFRQYASVGADQLTAPADAHSFGIFAYEEIDLGRGAALQLGVRLDRYRIVSKDDPRFGPGTDRAFAAPSGSLGVAVPVADAVTAALSVARSFRAPSVEELFSDAFHIGTASWEIGNPMLRPEYATSVDVALRAHGTRVSAELSVWANRIDHYITFAARGDTLLEGVRVPVLAYVQDAARFVGLEGQAEWLARPHLVLGMRGDALRAGRRDGTPLPFMPPARLSGSVRWDDGTRLLGVSLRHAFAQRRTGLADEPATDAATLLGAEAGLRFEAAGRALSVTLRADNLADRLYRDATSRIKAFAPNPGRNVSLLLRAAL
jgi:iron complex outermembrane receptor protein